MALNWAMLNPDRTPVPLPSEDTITTVKDAADIVLVIPNAPPSGSDTAGGAGGSAKFEAHKGNVYITSQRVRTDLAFNLKILTNVANPSW
jgi:hypothetical protein